MERKKKCNPATVALALLVAAAPADFAAEPASASASDALPAPTAAPPAVRPSGTPPTRPPTTPDAPRFTTLPDGTNPPVDRDGDFIIGPTYVPPPELEATGVAAGRVEQFTMDSADSRFYPGIARVAPGTADPDNPRTLRMQVQPQPWQRAITVYIPAGAKPRQELPLMVVHDGPKPGQADTTLPRLLDSLIAAHRIPALAVVMIQNGGGDAQGSERGLEYDTVSGRFAEFIEAEVLPAVERKYALKFTRNPARRAVMGCSSGAAAAFTMAWFHPEWYHRVISYSGTFVNQQWPFDAATPGGAWDYHDHLIAGSPAKPLRVWMHVGDRDLYNPNILKDGMHDWVAANHALARVLAQKGYHHQYVFALDSGHCDSRVRQQTLPEALEYIWRD